MIHRPLSCTHIHTQRHLFISPFSSDSVSDLCNCLFVYLPISVQMLDLHTPCPLYSQFASTTPETCLPFYDSLHSVDIAPPFSCSIEQFIVPSTRITNTCASYSASTPSSRKRKRPPNFLCQDTVVKTLRSWWSPSDECRPIHSATQSFPRLDSNLILMEEIDQLKKRDNDHRSDELEEVLNFLWNEDDTSSTAQSDPLNYASSDEFLMAKDWESTQRPIDSEYAAHNVGVTLYGLEDIIGDVSLPNREAIKQEQVLDEETVFHEVPSYATLMDWLDSEASRTRASYCRPWEEQREAVAQVSSATFGLPMRSWQEGIEEGTLAERNNKQHRGSWFVEEGGGGGTSGRNGSTPPPNHWQSLGTSALELAKDRSLKEGAGPPGGVRRASGSAWAGPTLLDIESALAVVAGEYCQSDHSVHIPGVTGHSIATAAPAPAPTTKSSPILKPTYSTTPSSQPISPIVDLTTILQSQHEGGPSQETSDMSEISAWRLKLQKRNPLEPKYTSRVESEEKALADGYRWRKYGQKAIKNSPYPRSYYRCSSSKCNAKKQVEKCPDDEGVFLVTYEGIHLHHKPNLLHKICTPKEGICALEDEIERLTSPRSKEERPSSSSSSTSC
ncbi:hypothetical protein KP509_02G075500 [Ceratopteris richardii]|uniref:WRKY domain-containing protein n=1 Tax=Ceratopteris richardii TaxID=49495 RepID=A0A8T2VFJ0_CERRI|nr:hypothetical protein KP509_02G075500 [Ceratopteris richardii]